MKIALLWPVYLPDLSAGSVRCDAFAKNLTRLGNEVSVITPSQSLGHETVETNSYEVRRISSYYALSKSLGYGAALLSFPVSLRKIRKAISEIHPDLVIASTPGPILAFEGFLATRQMNVPFVFDVRDPWRSGKYLHPGALRNWSKQLIEQFLCRRGDLVLCVTPTLGRVVARDYQISSEKIIIVRNGAWEAMEDVMGVEKEYDLVFLGSPSPYKDLEGLFEALAIAQKSYPLRILFVGWVENRYTKGLRNLVKNLRLSESIEFIPQTPIEEVRSLISKARIAIETVGGPPSIAWAVGAKNYEYLASGLPIACLSKYREGEMYNLITGEVGFIENDPASFAEELVETLEDSERLKSMSVHALEYSSRFTWKRIVSDVYESHLKKLVGDAS